MTGDAQRRATNRYRNANSKSMGLRFWEGRDMDLYLWAKGQPEGSGAYVKRLIREDMEHRAGDEGA